MRLISRYILWEFLKYLILTVVAFTLIFLLIDFMERIDNFLGADVPAREIVVFFLTFIPSVIYYLLPVALLVSLMIAIGMLARHSEIVAIKAGGVSLFRLSAPIIAASLLISALSFLLQDALIPITSVKANAIWAKVETEKGNKEAADVRRNIWFKNQSSIYFLQAYDEGGQRINRMSIFSFDPEFRLQSRREIRRAVRSGDHWVVNDVLDKEYQPDGEILVTRVPQRTIEIPPIPELYASEERPSEELSTSELLIWIKRMRNEGYDPTRYVVDLHFKFSFPFICTVVILFGLPLAFWKERGGGIAQGIGVGLGLSFIYLVFLGLSRSLGYSVLLPPIVAAWLPNLVFILFGAYLFTHMRQ